MAKKTWTVTLDRAELVYDVQNKTYLTGRSRQNGENHEEVAHMTANDDDENAYQVSRSVLSAFARLKTKLSEYLDVTTDTGSSNTTAASDNLVISLSMPSNYNTATGDDITNLCHQFIVNTAVSEWFTITNKNDAPDYAALAQVNLNDIREAASKRVRPKKN